jgi:NAD(P)-dependent dehydrogenase (short-subunit alcohol dehydrogenase family)
MTISLVTGAGSGIGAAAAKILSDRGDRVICADIDGDAARHVASRLPEATVVQVDVTDAASSEAMVAEAIAAYGRLDVAVACAGIEVGGDTLEFDAAMFRRIIDVNLTGSFLTAQHAARTMRDHGEGGSIVLIGSINSQMALPGAAAYCASKGGVRMLGAALAVDFAAHGIRVNVIGPGVTDTPMSADSLADPERRSRLMSRIPMDRPAGPNEIASAIAFLTSDGASYVTGAFLPVDGGWLAR